MTTQPNDTQKTSYLYFNTRDELTRINLYDVAYFEADGNYTHVILTNGCKTTILVSLSAIEHLIDNQLAGKVRFFVRIGRSYIVNSNHIFQINVLKQKLILTDVSSTNVFTLNIAKEALKALKELYTQKK